MFHYILEHNMKITIRQHFRFLGTIISHAFYIDNNQ
ncbi:unnamed protein product, partial [Didymodactylos carnosus]